MADLHPGRDEFPKQPQGILLCRSHRSPAKANSNAPTPTSIRAISREKGILIETDSETRYWKAGQPAKFSDIQIGDKLRHQRRTESAKERCGCVGRCFSTTKACKKFQTEQKDAGAQTAARGRLAGICRPERRPARSGPHALPGKRRVKPYVGARHEGSRLARRLGPQADGGAEVTGLVASAKTVGPARKGDRHAGRRGTGLHTRDRRPRVGHALEAVMHFQLPTSVSF